MGQNNIFGRNFWPIGQIFGQKSTFEIPKFEEILEKEKKQHFFFSNVAPDVT
jgi:hypothetical protein